MQAGRPAAADPLAHVKAVLAGPPLGLAAGCAAPLLDMFRAATTAVLAPVPAKAPPPSPAAGGRVRDRHTFVVGATAVVYSGGLLPTGQLLLLAPQRVDEFRRCCTAVQ